MGNFLTFEFLNVYSFLFIPIGPFECLNASIHWCLEDKYALYDMNTQLKQIYTRLYSGKIIPISISAHSTYKHPPSRFARTHGNIADKDRIYHTFSTPAIISLELGIYYVLEGWHCNVNVGILWYIFSFSKTFFFSYFLLLNIFLLLLPYSTIRILSTSVIQISYFHFHSIALRLSLFIQNLFGEFIKNMGKKNIAECWVTLLLPPSKQSYI